MAKYDGSEQKSKKRGRGGIVALVILLILAGAVGFLYYTIAKAPFQPDDPRKLAASEPMEVQDRFRFSAADGTARVRLDKADLWTLILANTGDDFLNKINRELSAYDVTVSGCALNLNENGPELGLELHYRDIRLVTKIPCDLGFSGKHISLTPNGVKLGVISLPVKSLLSSVKLEYDVKLPVITEVTAVSFEPGAIVLSGPMEADIRALIPQSRNLYMDAVFAGELWPLAEALHTQAGYDRMLAGLEKNPGQVEDLYRKLFVLADPKDTDAYLESRMGLTERFFPAIDFSAVKTEQAELEAQQTVLARSLEQFFTKAVNDYNEKQFRLSDGKFLYKKKPFQAAQYGGAEFEPLFQLLDPESVFLVLVDAENGFIRKTSSFYRMADEKQQFTREVDFNKTYILGCVFRGVGGEPYLLYDIEIQNTGTYVRSTKLQPLTEEEVAQLQEEGKFGVWTDRS